MALTPDDQTVFLYTFDSGTGMNVVSLVQAETLNKESTVQLPPFTLLPPTHTRLTAVDNNTLVTTELDTGLVRVIKKDAESPATVPAAASDLEGFFDPALWKDLAGGTYFIGVRWGDNSKNEDGFRVLRAVGGSGNFINVGTVGADVTEFIDNTVVPDMIYDYGIVAFNAMGDAPPSNEYRIILPPDAFDDSLFITGTPGAFIRFKSSPAELLSNDITAADSVISQVSSPTANGGQ